MECDKPNQDSVRCWMCGAVGSRLDEFTSPYTGMCAACSPRDGVTIPPMLVAAGVTQEELDAAADQGSVLPGVTKDELDAMVDQYSGLRTPLTPLGKYLEHSVDVQSGRPVAPLSRMEMARYETTAIEPVLDGQLAPTPSPILSGQEIGRATRTEATHLWVLASFDNGVRFGHDPRPPEESGLWIWSCSRCGVTAASLSQDMESLQQDHLPTCPGPSERRKLSERMRSFLGGREVPAEKKWRFENLLCWMDRYQEEDFPIPPHWVSEALGIMAEANAK